MTEQERRAALLAGMENFKAVRLLESWEKMDAYKAQMGQVTSADTSWYVGQWETLNAAKAQQVVVKTAEQVAQEARDAERCRRFDASQM